MKTKILVVDDDPMILKLFNNMLRLSGYEPLLASNDVEFHRLAFSEKPAVIILDLMLGEKDGSQLYDQYLAQGLDPKIPVIFLSALAQDRPPTPPSPDHKFALLGKPFDADDLMQRLRDLVSSQHR